MPKLDIDSVPIRTNSSYPAPFDASVTGRSSQRLGDAAGLTQFGANLVRLLPGARASLRHWHENQDEFVMVTSGTLVLEEDSGETELSAGDCAGFKAGVANGHSMVNRSDAEAVFLVIGTRTDTEVAHYTQDDLRMETSGGQTRFMPREGSAPADTPEDGAGIFAPISANLTEALVGGRFEAYRAAFHMPATINPRVGEGYTISTEEEMRQDYALYLQAATEQGITEIDRRVQRTFFLSPDVCVVEAEVHFRNAAGVTLVEPFVTTFRVERRGGVWRIGRVISSLGHINWTHGLSGISADMKFELD
ncbi:cupin domain-containing protein [Sagittula sp. NFXS13]|uniref:cupin domain-containing protein n=1 Tax=Sagittula sp. NFXS13 TaxID=2819095 RepID=UPI0032DF866C